MTEHPRFAQHVRDLAAAFKVKVLCVAEMPPENAIGFQVSLGPARVDAILIGLVVDETTYAVALHELGHILHPMGRVHHSEGSRAMREHGTVDTARDARLQYDAECAAWEWAKRYALEWTDPMRRTRRIGLSSYENKLRSLGIEVPK